MSPDSNAATQGHTRVAANRGRRRLRIFLFTAGSIAIFAGLALLAFSLAPMFIPGPDSAIVLAPAEAPGAVDTGPSTAINPSASTPGPKPAATTPRPNTLLDGYSFELRIPAIGYSGIVHQGVGAGVLAHGPGHYPTTPWPGSPGNVGVAAHNVYWLSFNRLKIGDQVQIVTQHGLYAYQITGSWVTDPSDRTVLAPTSSNKLTLTTCYPLWAGAFATKRLIFTAGELGGVA